MEFYRWLDVRHRDTYGAARLDSTKRLLQRHDLLPKYNETIEGEHVALFITTALLSPSFRYTKNGDQFVACLDHLVRQNESNLFSLLKLCFKDFCYLRTIAELTIDLSTGNCRVSYTDGTNQLILTKGLDLSKPGLRTFAIISREHLKDIYVRLLQGDQEGGQITSVEINDGILTKIKN